LPHSRSFENKPIGNNELPAGSNSNARRTQFGLILELPTAKSDPNRLLLLLLLALYWRSRVEHKVGRVERGVAQGKIRLGIAYLVDSYDDGQRITNGKATFVTHATTCNLA